MKTFVSVVVFAWAIGTLATSCHEPTSGGACSPIGTTRTDSDGQVWTCAKNQNTGNGYWYKGRP